MTLRRVWHLAFMIVFGVAGWAALAAATLAGSPVAPGVTPLMFAMFFGVVMAARALAFRMLPEMMISLDAAFYVAATACLGALGAGWLAAAALSFDAALRMFRGPRTRFGEGAIFILYFGGMTGGLLLVMGHLFGVGLPPDDAAEVAVLARVCGLGLSFLLAYYLVQGGRLVLAGQDARTVLGRMIVSIVTEASLLPLAVVVVLIYEPGRPLGLGLLSATYLLVNYVFNRLSHTSASLRQRVAELETLNRSAHALAQTLDRHELVASIGREVLAAIPEAELFSLAQVGDDELVVDWLDRDSDKLQRLHARPDEGLSGEVARTRATLSISDLSRTPHAVKNDASMRSWLGVPITVHDELLGVLSVQSRERAAFGEDPRRLLEAISAQAAVAIQNARHYELATVDGLTGLYVRRYFDTRLAEEVERSRRFETPFSLLLLDIDDFKKLNDRYGHGLGDRVLREAAQTMRRAMRSIDLAARFGGEEFAFILPRTSIVDAHAVAERIRHDLGELRLAHTESGKVLRMTASIGIACFPESGPGGAIELVERADVALYRAKATGKNRVELFWAEPIADTPGRGIKLARPAT